MRRDRTLHWEGIVSNWFGVWYVQGLTNRLTTQKQKIYLLLFPGMKNDSTESLLCSDVQIDSIRILIGRARH